MMDGITKQTVFRFFWLFSVLTLLTGCFGSASKDKEEEIPHYYVIDVDRGTVAPDFPTNRVLRLKPVRVTSLFRKQTLIFKVGDDEYQPQPPHQFFSQPEEMFTEQLKRWLQKSGLFSQVVTNDNVPADLVLETAVTALYGDHRAQFFPLAVLEMQIFLMSENENNSEPLFQTGLRIDVEIEETTPKNVVKGWRYGLEELLVTLEDDLRRYFLKHDPQ